MIKPLAFFHWKIHIRRLRSRPESYRHGSKVFNRFRVLITQYREAICLLLSSPRNFQYEIKTDKYNPYPSMISMFTSDSQHPPKSRHAVHLGVLCQFSSSRDNGQSMVMYYSGMKHAPPVIIGSWQQSEHGNISLKYGTCSVSCHRVMTTDRAWLFIPKVLNMLCRFSAHDNGQSMFIYPSGLKYAQSVVIVWWQRTEHGDLSLRHETCSVGCHRLMTTAKAWLYILQVWNMLHQLSSSHDNGKSMVIHPLGMQHAPSLAIVSLQQSEHGDTPQIWNMLRQLPLSHDNGQSMVMYSSGKKQDSSVVIVQRQETEHGYISLMQETCSVMCHRPKI